MITHLRCFHRDWVNCLSELTSLPHVCANYLTDTAWSGKMHFELVWKAQLVKTNLEARKVGSKVKLPWWGYQDNSLKERRVFSSNSANKTTGNPNAKKKKDKVGPCLILHTEINLKWTKKLNLRAKTKKLLEET